MMRKMLARGLLLCLCISEVLAFGRESRQEKEQASATLRQLLARVYELEVRLVRGQGVATEPASHQQLASLVAAAEVTFGLIRSRIPKAEAAQLTEQLRQVHGLLQKNPLPRAHCLAMLGSIRRNIWRHYEVEGAPALTPNRQAAQKVYGSYCASCHGDTGAGDGVLAGKIPGPKLQSFQDPRFGEAYSPFMALNLLLDGKEGSAMPGFKQQLSRDELWSLSYYLLTLPWQKDDPERALKPAEKDWFSQQKDLSLSFLAQNSDRELLTWLQDKNRKEGAFCLQEASCQKGLAFLRMGLTFEGALSRVQKAH